MMNSFLMVGQSNMSGRGYFEGFEQKINPDCFMLRMGRWQPLREPVNPDRPVFGQKFHSGVSMATSFADRMQQELHDHVGMIPCADGGTRIEEWLPGGILYDHAVMMTKLAMRSSGLRGIIWHQGESDCNGDDLGIYRERLITVLTSLRKDLGDGKLPLVIGEISTKLDSTRHVIDQEKVSEMNRILHEVAADLPACGIVETTDLEIQSDGIHFSAAAQGILGVRYAVKMAELLRS